MARTTDIRSSSPYSAEGFYDDLSQDYDGMTDWPVRLERERPFIKAIIDRGTVRSAIDVGTGTGLHAILLAELGVATTAVDLSERMLERLRSRASSLGLNVETRQQDMRMLAAPNQPTVDAVLCLGNTIAHLHTEEDLSAFLEGVRRSLNPGGCLIVHTLNYAKFAAGQTSLINARTVGEATLTRLYRPRGDLQEFVVAREKKGEKISESSTLHRPWRLPELLELLRASGAHTIETFGSMDFSPFDSSGSRDLILTAVYP